MTRKGPDLAAGRSWITRGGLLPQGRRRSVIGSALSLLILAFAGRAHSTGHQENPPPKAVPVPDPAAQKESEKLLREVFKDDYAKKQPSDRLALAKKLLAQALETRDDPSARFVLLRESRDLAVQGGDVETALNAILQLRKSFVIDVIPMKIAVLTTLGKGVKSAEDALGWARRHVEVMAEALEAEEFELAEKEAETAGTLAKRGKDMALVAKIEAQRKAISAKKSKLEQLKAARTTLEANPKDPAASFQVGQYECLVRGNWEKGLPLLSQGSDESLKELAKRDLAPPVTPSEQVGMGDAWWDLREKEKGIARENLGSRALLWYELASPKLTGLGKTKVDLRLQDLRLERLAKGDWVDVTDASLFGLKGKAGEPIPLPVKVGEVNTIVLDTKFPTGEMDGVTIRIHPEPGELKGALVLFEAQETGIMVVPHMNTVALVNSGPKGWHFLVERKLQRTEEYILTVLIEDGEYVGYLDGALIGKARAHITRIVRLEIRADNTSVKLDQIRLRRKG